MGETAYKRREMREGENFRERNKTWVSCTMCGVRVADSYLQTHIAWNHGICVPLKRGLDEVVGGPTTYMVSFPRLLQEVKCPVLGCLVGVHRSGRIREHFMYCHFLSNVVVLQEGAEPLPICDLSGMDIKAGRLIRHQRTAWYEKNSQMRWWRMDVPIAAR